MTIILLPQACAGCGAEIPRHRNRDRCRTCRKAAQRPAKNAARLRSYHQAKAKAIHAMFREVSP